MKGLELLFKIEKQNLRSKQDALVLATHCFLVNDGFNCVGIGDKWTDDSQEAASNSELLPDNWNEDGNVYSLRYQNPEGDKFMLKVVKSDIHVLINLLEIENQKASGTALIPEDYINEISDFKSTFKNLDQFSHKLHTDFLVKKKTEKGTETNTEPDLRIPNPPRRPPRYEDPDWGDLREPMRGGPAHGYGRSDLDPFGGGTGMIFNPLANRQRNEPDFGILGPRLPRGSVPPGARFDPFGPPNPDLQPPRGPGPGMFGPPPDYNDMFM